jgi:hypothetical protein
MAPAGYPPAPASSYPTRLCRRSAAPATPAPCGLPDSSTSARGMTLQLLHLISVPVEMKAEELQPLPHVQRT